LLKKSSGLVLASFRGATYGLGKRLLHQVIGWRVKTVYAFASSLTAALPDGLVEQPAG
jgi:hypothetical protein